MIARECNMSMTEVEALDADQYYRYAIIAIPREVAQYGMSKDETAELIEEFILGTDYSGNRELRAKAAEYAKRFGGNQCR